MRRQDFEIVAAAMRRVRPDYDEDAWRQWVTDVDGLANAFVRQWAKFDRKQFRHDCGVTPLGE